ncbi:MAG: hypothetical protein ABJP70_11560 [Erythrobacter sp.]
MMRWLSAYARCGVAGEGVVEAMDWSWKNTADMQRGLALATIGPVFAYAVAVGIFVIQYLNWDGLVNPYGNGWIIVSNLALSISIAWFQLLGVAAYRTIDRQSVDIVKTFE